MSDQSYLEAGANAPYADNRDDFETDVSRIADSLEQDYDLHIQYDIGSEGGTYVEVLGIKRGDHHLTIHVGRSNVFYSVDDFRTFVESFIPPVS